MYSDSDEDSICNSSNTESDILSSSNNRIIKNEPYQCEILPTERIVDEMANCINEVTEVINLPRTTILNLLNHFKWDKAELIARYFDGNEKTFFEQANIVNPFNKPKKSTTTELGNSLVVECEICSGLFPSHNVFGLECGHRYCTQCWNEYITIKIMDEGLAQFIECPSYGCDIIMDDLTVINFITAAPVKEKYQHLITNNFVECNRLLRWCPSAGCTYAIKVSYIEDSLPVVCKCNHIFCFACGENWHNPVKCQLLKKWIQKCNEDPKTTNWIVSNTKNCPNCNTNIEKSGGCNRMLCKKQNCQFEFCWVCLAPFGWAPHECNRYKTKDVILTRKIEGRNAKRYIHYYKRYMNHMKSLKFETKLYAKVKHKMDHLEAKHLVLIDEQFLKTAVDILCKCRQTLMYTYAFGYYLKKNNQSLIFEGNQNDLESATETLSGYLEGHCPKEDISDFRQKVQDMYRYCERRRKILLDHAYEGYEKGLWDIAAESESSNNSRKREQALKRRRPNFYDFYIF